MAPPPLAQLQARIAQLQQQAMTPYFSGGGHMTAGDPNNTNRVSQQQHDAAMAELAQLQPQLAAAQGPNPNDPVNRVTQARDKMYGLAQGRLDSLQGDPLDAQISSQLQGMITGQVAPYDQTTTNALITGATQGNADAAGNQYQSLLADYVAGGGNPNDPALQAEKRSLETNRMGANQDASLGILQNANVQNYNARRGALGQAAGFNSARNSAITNQSNYLGNLYSKEYATLESPSSYSYSSGGMQPLGGVDRTPGHYGSAPTSGPAMPTYSQWSAYSAQPQQPQQSYSYNPQQAYTPAYYGSSARNYFENSQPAGPATMQTAAPTYNPNWNYQAENQETMKARQPNRAQQMPPNYQPAEY